MFNMEKQKNTNYKKISLRDFRHNLTQLKDSLAAGQIYEVTDRNNPFGYFIPNGYEFTVTKKQKLNQDDFHKIMKELNGMAKPPKFVKNPKTDDDIYRNELLKRYYRN